MIHNVIVYLKPVFTGLYLEFIPYFIKSWKKLYPTVDVKIILINDTIPEEYKEYNDNIIYFKPIENISTAFISHYIRLLYPCILNYDNGILISDIDMIPMNNTHYTKNIEHIDNNKFIYYRDWGLDLKQVSMCYNIAHNTTWKNIFNIHNINDIILRIKEVYNTILYNGVGKEGWDKDQRDLYYNIMEWNKKTNNFIYLYDNKTGKRRLGRNRPFKIEEIKDNIKKGYYSDYHCLRPYSKYKHINDKILEILPDK